MTVFGKPDCSLCSNAEAIVQRLARDYAIDVEKRDITSNGEVFERYRYVIPVVEIAHGPTFEGKITEHRLRRALHELTLQAKRPP